VVSAMGRLPLGVCSYKDCGEIRPMMPHPLEHGFTQMNTVFMLACMPGDTTISVSTMGKASTPAMKMATACVKSM
jgi:hypothetical protein